MSDIGLERLARQASEVAAADIYSFEQELNRLGWTPIEVLFFAGFFWLSLQYARHSSWRDKVTLDEAIEHISTLPEGIVLGIFPQCQIEDWRVDFLFIMKPDIRLIVECDGHDFHERTKEQAAKDRARDRDVQAKGFTVFRFTGSELYRDPLGCAQQAFDWLRKKERDM